jgi:hypothetical protein
MSFPTLFRSLLLMASGAVFGAFLNPHLMHPASAAPAFVQNAGRNAAPDPAALLADVARLKDAVPAQSHAMIDVGYHMANLWFAVQKRNWPFAAFEVDETRNRIRWAIRIQPVRKDAEGKEVDLKGIFDGIDTSSLAALKDVVEKKDAVRFVAAYRTMLESCYSCHKSSGKPYLRPMIPTAQPQPIINYDPNARWPE